MKRLWIALTLLLLVVGLCVISRTYLYRRMGDLLDALDTIETHWAEGDKDTAVRLAEAFVEEYHRVRGVLDGYVAHNDLEESEETAALLPTLFSQGGEEELRMELARLREQLIYLRTIDDPLWRNIL